ncbi:MAG: M50 family metallopeptidase [Deltaproteobacteria bacterium]|nr:M50 family metallopeptidase [Deltaproteobacteria bacterium]
MSVATVAGIPIRVHWSLVGLMGLYFAFALITAGMAETLEATSVVVALFASVVLHELGHALAARNYGIRTAHITLYPFGGIAAITRAPATPFQELFIALAGPAVNLFLATLFFSLWTVSGAWLALAIAALNLIMGVFNLFPAYPMDGGRVLRALLVDRYGWVGASRIAMRVGRIFAWLFIGVGLVGFVPSLVLVGGFLLFALAAERRRMEQMVALRLWREHVPFTGMGPAPARRWSGARGPQPYSG